MITFIIILASVFVYLVGAMLFQLFWVVNVDEDNEHAGLFWPVLAPFMLFYWLPSYWANLVKERMEREKGL